ncbi:putative lipid II flippase FtsW [Candidatus Parcubacteria bacterium]|nr:MAG: putative lipid II flippase FtsW [Candidatus Parcubacteria bacterium]
MGKLIQKFKRILSSGHREHSPDYILIGSVFLVVLFGLIMLSSASSIKAYMSFGNTYYYFNHQLFGIGIGMIAFFAFSRLNYRIWQEYAGWFLIGSIFLLLLVFIPGLSAAYGKARSWINVFGFSLQPSEFVKISFLLYLAAWLDRRSGSLKDIREGIGPFVFVLSFIGLLMLLQPDFGTLSIIAFTSLVVYYVGGGSKRHIAYIVFFGILGFILMINLRPYQMNRVKCMIDPSYSPDDICFQINQSLIAVGSGGFWGRGFGESRQKFSYIPEVSSDSIFAIIGEETGMLFGVILLLLYLVIFYRGVVIAKKAPDGYGRILAIGIVTWLATQAIINIGGIINLMPMTGVPLPFISYGGSAMLASLISVGILVNISKQTKLR